MWRYFAKAKCLILWKKTQPFGFTFFSVGVTTDNPLYNNVSANTVRYIILTLLDVFLHSLLSFIMPLSKQLLVRNFMTCVAKDVVPERWTKNGSATRSSIFPPLDYTPPSSAPRTTSRLSRRAEHCCETQGHSNAVLDTFPFLHPCEDSPDATVICQLWFRTAEFRRLWKIKLALCSTFVFFKNAPTD